MNIVEVVVDVPLFGENQFFDYRIPHHLEGRVFIGSRVIVPFGSRKVEGYVIRLKADSDFKRLREIFEVLDEVPPLTPELVEVGEYISNRYFSSFFNALQIMVPASLRSKYQKWIVWNHERDDLPLIVLPEEEEVLLFVQEKREIELKNLLKQFPDGESIISRFVQKGYLHEVTRIGDEKNTQTIEVIHLAISHERLIEEINALHKNAFRQKKILEAIKEASPLSMKELLIRSKASRQSVLTLVDKGILTISEEVVYRDPYKEKQFPKQQAKIFTPEQQQAYDNIISALNQRESNTFLLHGVTGSGKTEVYLQVIDTVIKDGREAIVLVPEISLTPMMVERFKSRFGEKVAVLHSRLSAGERLDEWRRIRNQEAAVVVGARSAIFAPLTKIGMIIIDEEHEGTYKQDEMPRYHARDVAIKRAELHEAVVVLGSATPSLESYAYSKTGRFTLLEMGSRVNEQALPTSYLVDMRQEMEAGHRHMFSRLLLTKIEERLNKKEQIVLLLNRRGHSTFVLCRSCGTVTECPHCDISLTYHQVNQTIRCHYCGFTTGTPKSCPKCNSQHIRFFGTGTQKVEEELVKQFPGIRVIRMDHDTTTRKGAHERMLESFGNYEADVLLGTQMIAKGLDFPNVTLVGMIATDTSLHLPDFRAAERTFQLITQVSGRAGRHELPGEVVLQTYQPDHYSIQLSVKQDYQAFFNEEIRLRKRGNYPPFYRIGVIHFSHPEVPKLVKVMDQFCHVLRIHLSDETHIFGPAPAQIARIKDRYRYQCMIKYKDEPALNRSLKYALESIDEWIQKDQIYVGIDIDPQVLM